MRAAFVKQGLPRCVLGDMCIARGETTHRRIEDEGATSCCDGKCRTHEVEERGTVVFNSHCLYNNEQDGYHHDLRVVERKKGREQTPKGHWKRTGFQNRWSKSNTEICETCESIYLLRFVRPNRFLHKLLANSAAIRSAEERYILCIL